MATALRPLATAWAAAAFLPVPLLLMIDPSENAGISCLYLGLASAWLATEILRSGGIPDSRSAWRHKTIAICVALTVNVALFIFLGLSVAVQSNIPFPLMAVLSVIPAIGLISWLTLRIGQPFKAMVLGAVILLAAKLTGCVVARIVYGPNFIEQGYVAGDWRTARLMISTFWILATTTSLGLLVAGYWQLKPHASQVERSG
ncbi:MAG: hypothetical protein JWN24_4326 [Phycisphaerales bacterium]|nr:hypothetical protein [Phycisphaerales bacterium]